jgi:ATP-dependent Clp protease adaptor protein ClpS
MAPEAPTVAPGTRTEERVKEETKLAPRWRVILHNDDITTFEFVVGLLVTIFQKEPEEALRLTQEVHTTGAAVVIVTTQERAELYVEQVHSLARPRGFPLAASMEPE